MPPPLEWNEKEEITRMSKSFLQPLCCIATAFLSLQEQTSANARSH
jgi:hypothetical protein